MPQDHKELVGLAALNATKAHAEMVNALLTEDSGTYGAFRNRAAEALCRRAR